MLSIRGVAVLNCSVRFEPSSSLSLLSGSQLPCDSRTLSSPHAHALCPSTRLLARRRQQPGSASAASNLKASQDLNLNSRSPAAFDIFLYEPQALNSLRSS